MASPATSELTAFEEFLQLCENEGLSKRPAELTPEDVVDGINDTTTLRRFFNARNGDSTGALHQLQESAAARAQVHDISTYENIDVNLYEQTRKIYPHWTGRRSKRGLPICAYTVSSLDPATLSEYYATSSSTPISPNADPNQTQRAFAFHDTLTRFILPLCTAMRDRPEVEKSVHACVIVVDVSTFGLKQAWNVRRYAQDISGILAVSFPEVLERVYVVNAPFYFARLWAIVKVFVDPRTVEKLVILSPAETLPELSKVIEIDSIPTQFGGKFAYEPGMRPQLDEGMKSQLQWIGEERESLPPGPLKWVQDEEGVRTAVVTGRKDGEKVRLGFARVREETKEREMVDSGVGTPTPLA